MKKYSLLLIVSMLLPVLAWGQQLFSGGDGSQGSPYQISNEADLRNLSKMVADKANNGFVGKYFTQTANITLSGENFTPIGGSGSTLVPKWEKEFAFNGVYDGGMHKIYNLNINTEDQLLIDDETYEGERFRVGLFGAIGGKAVIKNVVIASGHIYGSAFVGGIVGWMKDEGSIVTHCKVANKVHVYARYVSGGIVGAGSKKALVEKCANYGNIRSYGNANISGCAAGIVAYPSDTRIEGCANFGDIYSATSFVGGIAATYPVTVPGKPDAIKYEYPPMKSCMNAADVTSRIGVAGGLIGAWPYAPMEEDADPNNLPEKIAMENCYSYGQSYVATKKTFGPVIAFVQKNYPQKVVKTFYNAERYFYKEDPTSGDSEIAFIHGESKTHAHMRSDAFLGELNAGSLHQFGKDVHNFNYGMPVLQWIIDSYDPEIDLPLYAEKNLAPAVHREKAGSFFRPNRAGEFIMVNMDMQTPNVQMKSLGHTIYRAWGHRVFQIEGEQTYRFFNSMSRFRRPFNEDGSINMSAEPEAASHWLITPEFEVKADKKFITWKAGSEYEWLEGYKVFVADADATTPEQFSNAKLVFETAGEEQMVEVPASAMEPEHYKLKHRAVDLSEYVGRKIRLAFVDDTKFKFSLMLGMFKMSETGKDTGNEMVLPTGLYSVRTEAKTIVAEAQGAELYFELYDVTGKRLSVAKNSFVYTGAKGVYVLKVQDQLSRTEVRKIVL